MHVHANVCSEASELTLGPQECSMKPFSTPVPVLFRANVSMFLAQVLFYMPNFIFDEKLIIYLYTVCIDTLAPY